MSGEGKIVRAITGVTAILMVSKVLALLRNILQAQVFGVGPEVDLFTLANNYTISLFTTVAYALCVAALPIFSKRLLKGKEQAYDAANRLISLFIVCSLAVTALFLVLDVFGIAQRLVGAGNEALFRQCFAMLAISFPIIVVTYLMVSLFQAMEYYSLQGTLSLLYNIVLCTVLFVVREQMSLRAFALIAAVGWLLQLAVVIPVAKKEGYRFRFTFRFAIPELRGFFKTCGATILTTAVFLLCYLINSRFAAGMAEGTVSAYYYAEKIFEPMTTTIIYGIGIVMFPKFNQQYERLGEEEYCGFVSNVLKNSVLLILPVSILLFVFGSPIIKVLFLNGVFDMEATEVTGTVFSAYALGMSGFFVLDILSKAYFAMGKTKQPAAMTLTALGVCLAANAAGAVIMPELADVLAWGTSAALLLSGAAMYIHFCHSRKLRVPIRDFVKGIVLSVLMGIGVYSVYINFVSMETRKLILVPQCIMLGVVGMIVYLTLMGQSLSAWEAIRKMFKGDKR